ncbi:ATP-binding protein [Ramlibacter sp. RBP-2]|uniref:ATP-binding protein n=1 Tax=Ramlibacter lithotrophicus TaxID=2606681 RepID=A0A7X6DEB5_9BURK|nr:ATP-binding protein [Ramlibacter lithotrophicus]
MTSQASSATSPAAPPPPVVLFITGPAACGKSTLAREWVRHRLQRGDPWTLIDKDLVGGQHGPRILELMGADPNDRDSPLFKQEVRDLDYRATLQLADEQLRLGGSVALPGPWTRELVAGLLEQPEQLGLPAVPSVVVWMSLSDAERRRRVEQRGNPLDRWKLKHWAAYAKGSRDGAPPECKGPAPVVLPAEQPLAEQLATIEALVARKRAG